MNLINKFKKCPVAHGVYNEIGWIVTINDYYKKVIIHPINKLNISCREWAIFVEKGRFLVENGQFL